MNVNILKKACFFALVILIPSMLMGCGSNQNRLSGPVESSDLGQNSDDHSEDASTQMEPTAIPTPTPYVEPVREYAYIVLRKKYMNDKRSNGDTSSALYGVEDFDLILSDIIFRLENKKLYFSLKTLFQEVNISM